MSECVRGKLNSGGDPQDRIAQNELPTRGLMLADLDASYRFPVGASSTC